MKRKGNKKNKAGQILDNDQYLDISTASSSNNTNRTLSTFSNNNSASSSSTSSSNNNGIFSTLNNHISSTSSNDKNPAPPSLSVSTNSASLSIDVNSAPLSINTNSTALSINTSPIPLLVNINQTTPSNNTNSIGRKSFSNVWLYAKKSADGKTAICQLCNYTCSLASHSTSTIRYHLVRQHNKQDLIIGSSSSSSTTPSISEQFKRELHTLCYNAIVLDHRPFNDFRKQGILSIFNKLCPGYLPPHRNQVSNNLKHLYNQHFQILKDELKEADYVGLTMDFWSTRSSVSYICITGHWYKNHMDFNSKVLHFATFNERHTADNIARCLKEILLELQIYDKVTGITCDGGPNLIAACNKLDGFIKRIWCTAHRLHLVVTNGLGIWNDEKEASADQVPTAASTSTEVQTTTAASILTEIQAITAAVTSTESSISIITTSDVISKNNEEPMDTIWYNEHEQGNLSFDQVNNDINGNDVLMLDNNETQATPNDLTEDEVMNETQSLDLITDNWSIHVETHVAETEEVQSIVKLLKKCRTIATATKKSSIISNFMRTHKLLYKVNKTINGDCRSRWNSTYGLIDSIKDAKELLIKLFVDKKTLKLRKDQLDKLATIELNDQDWELLSSLQHVLKPFFYATNMMSGKYYPSIGLAYHAIHKIKKFCSKYDEDENEHVYKLKRLLLTKIYKYFYQDMEQLEYLKYHAYFDPVAHRSLDNGEKDECEKYIKHLIFNNIYPQKQNSFDIIQVSSSNPATATTSTTPASLQHPPSQPDSSKMSTYDHFIAACGEQISSSDTSKEKSKRISLNEELKYFKTAVQEFNLQNKPSTTSAIEFWKKHYLHLPLLSNLARAHLVACGSSVPSESAFSCSAFVARKERSRLSPENLAYTVFLKDKLGKK